MGFTQTLWVPGPLPGMNDWIDAAKGFGGRGVGYSKLKAAWTDKVMWLAKADRIKPVTAARFVFHWLERKRNRDPDNIAAGKKAVLDGLVEAKVLPGDGWAAILGWTDTFEIAATPGVLVTIESA